jgi:preprotein translocase subunit SecD
VRSSSTLLGFFGVLVLSIFAIIVVWPQAPSQYLPGHFWPHGQGFTLFGANRDRMRLGLDLSGGTRLVLEANPPPGYTGDLKQAVDGAKRVIENRVNSLGVSEAEIQTANGNRIIVSLPGVSQADAEAQVGRTAELKFKVYDDQGNLVDATGVVGGQVVTMSGRYLKNNTVPARTAATYEVQFETTGVGSQLMEQITSRALKYPPGDQRNLLIVYLDDQVISAPGVNGVISDKGVITGQATFTESKNLSDLLNSGALPVPMKTIQSSEVSATLGADSVVQSVHAGEVGLLAVMMFMILYYRLPGVLASAALVVYASLTLMVFKLWPVTLTLSGIAAFVLSIGIAVDANILIFERMKEELRRGRTLHASIDIGFRRAWPSIRDSNVSTLITCLILYWFGGQFGATVIKGFALTLAIGVGVSMFSAISVTRTFLLMVLGTPLAKSHWLFNAEEVTRPPVRGAAAGAQGE